MEETVEKVEEVVEEERKISTEDLNTVKDAKNNTVLQQLNAEKSVAISKMAQLEEENLIFKLYLKYNLTHGVHSITSEGVIVEMNKEAEKK